MAVPLRVEDRVLGVLHIAVEGGQTIPPEHVDLAEMLAAQLAMAILESRNFAQQQEEAWVTTVLLEVARHAARPGDAEDALQAVLQLTTLLAGTRWAILLLTDQQQGALRLGPLAGLGRRLQAEHTDLRISPEEIGLRPPYLESDRPYPITLPAHLAEHFDNTVLASGLVLSDGTSLLGVLLVEGQEFIGRRPALLAGIGHQISLRLENTHLIETIAARRSLEREVAMARSIQESFLPKSPPSHPGWQIGTTWQVAREVGGDFYDFIPLAPGPDGVRWGIAIADVADKGVPAALFMALCRTLLRSVAISRIDPGITLTRLNELIFADTQSDMFVSVFYGVWEPEAGRLTYANGGHNPPLLFLPEQPARMLTEHEMVLGVGQDVTYSTHSIRLAPGALLVLYTDGVTEAMDGTGDLFGVHRLENLVRGMNEWDAQSVANHITRRVLDFCADPDLPDDLTAVVLRRSE
jgi:serine phosphatase RsbU (regulator of sigma subunit)